jgi:hypothetical protein
VLRDGQAQMLRVRTGVTDGTATAIVGGDLKEGDQVITGVTDAAVAAPQQTSTSPLIPFGRRGGGNRGGGAAGGGARGGGR